MRLFAGMGTASDTNRRFKSLLGAGGTGLSTAFDMPTLMGRDSDHPWAVGEVGRAGVAIDTIADMEALFSGIDLSGVSTSMTINGPANILMAMYIVTGERGGTERRRLSGTIQNDILKEYQAQKEYIFPPRPSMRLVTDLIRFTTAEMPRWHPVSISGYHIREAGSTAAQELAFTLANGFAYVEAAMAAGLDVDEFAGRLSFFFNSHIDFFEEIGKFRAARRIWAHWMRDRYGARQERSLQLRFHTQTAGVSLTAQQPEVNVARVATQALAAVLGGTQSLHTDSYDEALALPTERAARIALRTQQVIAHETGAGNVADPLGGAGYVEWMTDEMERRATEVFEHLDKLGGGSILEGVYEGIANGYFVGEIADSAYRFEREVNAGRRITVGVNAFTEGDDGDTPILYIDDDVEELQLRSLNEVAGGATTATWLTHSVGSPPTPPSRRSTSWRPSSTACAPRPARARSWRPSKGCSAPTPSPQWYDSRHLPRARRPAGSAAADRAGQAGARRPRPGPEGRGPDVARRGPRGDLPRAAPDDRVGTERRRAGGRRCHRTVDPQRRAPDPRPAHGGHSAPGRHGRPGRGGRDRARTGPRAPAGRGSGGGARSWSLGGRGGCHGPGCCRSPDMTPERAAHATVGALATDPSRAGGTAAPDGASGDSDIAGLFERARGGDRRALGRLLTFTERGGPEADAVAVAAWPLAGNAHIVGITGAPGVGKSTLTDRLAQAALAAGRRVAILAVDPSSPLTGGAILGDRVRMTNAAEPGGAFIRSMATRGQSGGLALAALAAVRLLDAVGAELIIVETVGIGQVEVDIANAADTTVVAVSPAGGTPCRPTRRDCWRWPTCSSSTSPTAPVPATPAATSSTCWIWGSRPPGARPSP